jgi:hypothetical protein
VDAHEKPVHLTFGQGKRALVIDRILRGEHHEGRADRVGLTIHGHPGAVHHLQQSGLGLRCGAVDFIRQHDVREDRTPLEDELTHGLVVDRHPGDITGQQVAGELDAREDAVHRAGERVRQRGLPHSGQILDQQVAAGGEADQDLVNDIVLALDVQAHVGADARKHRLRLGDGGTRYEVAHEHTLSESASPSTRRPP